MPSNDHYVIIGNGPAGNHAASTLRDKDRAARITIISDECIPYYYKPKLTGFIQGKVSMAELMVKDPDDYKDIRIRLGQTINRIDPELNAVFLNHMEKIQYTRLIIASGSQARVLPSMTPYAGHLNFVTSCTDVQEIKDQIDKAEHFFIFGGDLVGFKFLRMLKEMGKKTSVLIYSDAFWPYNLTDDMLEKITGNLAEFTSDVLVKDDIKSIEKKGSGFQILTQRGIEKNADLIFSFNGMTPNIDFAVGCGLDTDHGILADEYLKTNIDNIYTCGSCAQVYNPSIKSYSVSIGWPNAAVQGEVAALNLLGDQKVIKSVGRKYFDLEGVKIKTTWWDDFDNDSLSADEG